jgi:hypothetical protein
LQSKLGGHSLVTFPSVQRGAHTVSVEPSGATQFGASAVHWFASSLWHATPSDCEFGMHTVVRVYG